MRSIFKIRKHSQISFYNFFSIIESNSILALATTKKFFAASLGEWSVVFLIWTFSQRYWIWCLRMLASGDTCSTSIPDTRGMITVKRLTPRTCTIFSLEIVRSVTWNISPNKLLPQSTFGATEIEIFYFSFFLSSFYFHLQSDCRNRKQKYFSKDNLNFDTIFVSSRIWLIFRKGYENGVICSLARIFHTTAYLYMLFIDKRSRDNM